MVTVLVAVGLLIGQSRRTRKFYEQQKRQRVDKCEICKKSLLACKCNETTTTRNRTKPFEQNGHLWCPKCRSIWRGGSCTNPSCHLSRH